MFSRGGCRLNTRAPLEIGEMIRIEVPRLGGITALVRWAKGFDAGAAFVIDSRKCGSVTVSAAQQ